jgi:hypothetical protein
MMEYRTACPAGDSLSTGVSIFNIGLPLTLREFRDQKSAGSARPTRRF